MEIPLRSKKVAGVDYRVPNVSILHASPLWVGEVAARTAYDSFISSEHVSIQEFDGEPIDVDIESSKILNSLAWVYHHHSVIELIDISFSIKGMSRGALQEHARHRHQSLTVRSTRYTMQDVLNAFIACWCYLDYDKAVLEFDKIVKDLGVLIVLSDEYHKIETKAMFDKLKAQILAKSVDFNDMLSKEGLGFLLGVSTSSDFTYVFKLLQGAKKKRNVGDKFKHIVTDNWSVDLVCKFNLRSLKNYLELRNSGAAYFGIRMVAEEMIKVIPSKYLELIIK